MKPTLYIYALDTCEVCKAICGGLDALGYSYERLDADADEHQGVLDINDVDMLPFVQLIDDDGRVVWQKSSEVTLKDIIDQYETKHGTRTRG